MSQRKTAARPASAGSPASGGTAIVLPWRLLSQLVCLMGVMALLPGCGATPPAMASPTAPAQVSGTAPVSAGTSVLPAAAREALTATPRPVLGAATDVTDRTASRAVPEPTPSIAPLRPTPTPPALDDDVAALVQHYTASGVRRVGLIIRDPSRGVAVEINPDVPMEAASFYKLFVLWRVQAEIRAGRLCEDTKLVVGPATDRAKEDGYRLAPYGEWISVAVARRLMITESNNTAAWLLFQTFGWSELDPMLHANGFDGTTMNVVEPTTTARDIDRFFAGVVAQNLDPALEPDDYRLMLDLLTDQRLNHYLSPGFPPEAVFAHKTGELAGVWHDAGVLLLPDGRTVFITVMTEGQYDACLEFMQEVAQLTWRTLGVPS